MTRVSGGSLTFAGFVGNNQQGRITNSYSTGAVLGGLTDRGFAGVVNTGLGYYMSGNFWDNQTSGQASTQGNAEGRTTAQMNTIGTFSGVGWNIGSHGTVFNDGYPFLSWQVGSSTPIWLIFVEGSENGNGNGGGVDPSSLAFCADFSAGSEECIGNSSVSSNILRNFVYRSSNVCDGNISGTSLNVSDCRCEWGTWGSESCYGAYNVTNITSGDFLGKCKFRRGDIVSCSDSETGYLTLDLIMDWEGEPEFNDITTIPDVICTDFTMIRVLCLEEVELKFFNIFSFIFSFILISVFYFFLNKKDFFIFGFLSKQNPFS